MFMIYIALSIDRLFRTIYSGDVEKGAGGGPARFFEGGLSDAQADNARAGGERTIARRPGAGGGRLSRGHPPQRDPHRRESTRPDRQSSLVQQVGAESWRLVHRSPAVGVGYAVVHRSRCRHRWRLGKRPRLRAADLQQRFHRDDGEAAVGHLLERRRGVHCRRLDLHRSRCRWTTPACLGARPSWAA